MSNCLEIPDNFDFPYTPYPIQHDFMSKLYSVIENRQLGIFESPTGTGKSLSIICGVIRWLKDHNDNERKLLKEKLKKLESERSEVGKSSDDWLSSQSKEIELTYKINELKIEENRILEYDKKINKLREKKNKKNLKRFVTTHPKTDNYLESEHVEKENDDNLLLLEEADYDNLSDDENEDEQVKYKPTKIYICSRTHSQLSQFIGEIRKSLFYQNIRVVSLASRQNYCINPQVTALKNNNFINEKCSDMQKKSNKSDKTDGKVTKKLHKDNDTTCPYFKQQVIDELKDLALIELQDIEDLVKNGKELKACPYYASRKAVEDAEIILVPYNTILHKPTREANGIDLNNNIIIIDEAHNLLEALSQMHNSELNLNQIELALHQLKCYKQRFHTKFSANNLLNINQLIFILTKLQQHLSSNKENEETKTEVFKLENFVLTAQIDNYNMFKLIKFCKDSKLAQKIRNYVTKYSLIEESKCVKSSTSKVDGVKFFLASLKQPTANSNSQEIQVNEDLDKKINQNILSNPLLTVIAFLQSLTYSCDDGRIIVHKNPNKTDCKFQFLLLNPSSDFSNIIKEARSVIVAGGTMKPISEFRDRLFVNSGAKPEQIVEFSCDHIIEPDNILPIIVTKGFNNESLLFNLTNRDRMGNCVKETILESCKKVIGGIIVFFSSYKYEELIWQQIKNLKIDREVFREPKDSGSVDIILEKYSKAIRKSNSKGALLLSVVGGKLSEGLNFSDDLGRCIIVIGLPYANIKAIDLQLKMSFLDKYQSSGAGRQFYENLCMKSVNQCIGRAVRHCNDYATVLLLDERYSQMKIKNNLPGWIQRSLKDCTFTEAFDNIDKFFEKQARKMNFI